MAFINKLQFYKIHQMHKVALSSSYVVKPRFLSTDVKPAYKASQFYDRLMLDTKDYRDKIVNHQLFGEIKNLEHLKIFMENHSFAVYDFMTLLKSLQNRFTSVRPLWTPPKNKIASRLINEIVLGEETDEVKEGEFMSHYELYMQAMEQIGADTKPVLALSQFLENNHKEPIRALEKAKIAGASDCAIEFVKDTFSVSINPNKLDVEVAAYFLFGREDPIPDMFRSLLKQVPGLYMKKDFVLYLERHIHLDEEQHGPMARRLLESLCKEDEKAWKICTDTAVDAISSRIKLWDGTLKQIK